jgi:SAM-dependent methyltransferase
MHPTAPAPTDPYDALPYRGRAVWGAHPERLALSALLSGIEPAHPARCRYLELACGPGGNVIPLAYHLDGSRFVGVDRGQAHYEMASEQRDRLGLDNLELVCADLMDLDPEIGEFDYVVAHGVFSWVPKAARLRILEICARHLAPHGVAYISYNALPGWGIRGEIRRVLRRAVRGIDGASERLRAARARLELLRAALESRNDPHSLVMRQELDLAHASEDWLLFHDYLAPINVPFAFPTFLELAERHGLAYIADLVPAVGSREAEQMLEVGLASSIEDSTELELAKDTLTYRQFRATVLVRREALSRASAGRPHAWMRFATPLRPKNEPELASDDELVLVGPGSTTEVTASSPLLKAALLELVQVQPDSLALLELVERATARLTLGGLHAVDRRPSAEDVASVARALLTLRERGHVEVRLSDRPTPLRGPLRVGALTRLEAARGAYLTTPTHHVIRVDEVTRTLIRFLDGSHTVSDLVDCLITALQRGELPMRLEGEVEADPETLRQLLPAVVEQSLATLGAHDLLSAP